MIGVAWLGIAGSAAAEASAVATATVDLVSVTTVLSSVAVAAAAAAAESVSAGSAVVLETKIKSGWVRSATQGTSTVVLSHQGPGRLLKVHFSRAINVSTTTIAHNINTCFPFSNVKMKI